jgi:hypothetical protein
MWRRAAAAAMEDLRVVRARGLDDDMVEDTVEGWNSALVSGVGALEVVTGEEALKS